MGKVSMKFITLLNQLVLPQVTRKTDPTVDANPQRIKIQLAL
jgi:hypothetical protein